MNENYFREESDYSRLYDVLLVFGTDWRKKHDFENLSEEDIMFASFLNGIFFELSKQVANFDRRKFKNEEKQS